MKVLAEAFIMALLVSALAGTIFPGIVQAAAMWSQTYGGAGFDEASSLVITSDGGYAIAGYTDSFGAGGSDFWLVKTDASGTMEWNMTYGGTGGDAPVSLVEASDGGYALAGFTNSSGAGYNDFWLVKTDAFGNMEWNQTYGGTGMDWGSSLVEASDGGYALAGTTDSVGAGSLDGWLVKTDAFGNMEWNMTYGGETVDSVQSMVKVSDGGYAMVANTRVYASPVGNSHVLLIKTDAFGNMEWNQTYDGADHDSIQSMVEASDGGYALAGSIDSSSYGYLDFWLIKTDENGVAPVVPESAWVILPLLLTATSAIFISKKKLLHPRSKER